MEAPKHPRESLTLRSLDRRGDEATEAAQELVGEGRGERPASPGLRLGVKGRPVAQTFDSPEKEVSRKGLCRLRISGQARGLSNECVA